MKILGGLMAAVANFFVIVQSEDLMDVVKDFIAVAIIYQADNLMSVTVTDDV
jgi:hypothetical protein